MNEKITEIFLLVLLGAVVIFHVTYFACIRETLSDIGPFTNIAGANYGMNTRETADRFIWCFCSVCYFLYGYLWFGKKSSAGWMAGRKDRKTKLFLGFEILCQVGMILVYVVLWLRNINETMSVLYLELRRIDFVTYGLVWMEEHWNQLTLIMLLAPILLALIIDVLYFLYRLIWYQHKGHWNRKWIVCNLLWLILTFCLLIKQFEGLQYDDSWEEWLLVLPWGGWGIS